MLFVLNPNPRAWPAWQCSGVSILILSSQREKERVRETEPPPAPSPPTQGPAARRVHRQELSSHLEPVCGQEPARPSPAPARPATRQLLARQRCWAVASAEQACPRERSAHPFVAEAGSACSRRRESRRCAQLRPHGWAHR